MVYEVVWMGIGAAVSWAASTVYNNKKFKEALSEEVDKAKANLREKLK